MQKNLGLYGLNNIYWTKRVLDSICLSLSKSFYWRAAFCSKSIFCCRFVFYCRSVFCYKSLPLALLFLGFSCFLVFLVGLWAILFIGLSSSWVLGMNLQKRASTI